MEDKMVMITLEMLMVMQMEIATGVITMEFKMEMIILEMLMVTVTEI